MKKIKMFLDWIKRKFVLFDYTKDEELFSKKKTLRELDFLDDVWIKDQSENLLKGWVFDINKKHIFVTVPTRDGDFLDFRFIITRPLSQTKLEQNGLILYLNESC